MKRRIHCLLVGLVAIASTSIVVNKNGHESIKSAKTNQTRELRNEIRNTDGILATKIEWIEHDIADNIRRH